MTTCQRCKAKSQLFLCSSHIDELRDMFVDLPRLTHHLAESAHGQTRLGERSRRSRSDETPMRVNLKASDLLNQVNATLIRTVADVCRRRDISYRAVRIVPPAAHDGGLLFGDDICSPYDGDTAKLAFWLARHTADIAIDDNAGDCYNEIHAHIGRILSILNRPIPPRFCGPCPAPHPDDPARQCNMALMAKREAVEVRCPQCETTHNVDDLLRRLLIEVDHWRFTVKEILMIMDTLGERLHERTFQRWRKANIVRPSGYRRPDGRVTLKQHDREQSEPMYRLSDIRRAKARQTTMTGSDSK